MTTKMGDEGNLVLIYYQDKPAIYARIESIEPDIKKNWYQVSLLLLTIPAKTVTWILREEYINGASFTMGGQAMRLEEVPRFIEAEKSEDPSQSSGTEGKGNAGKVIPFKKE
jgi:hypothetical protein